MTPPAYSDFLKKLYILFANTSLPEKRKNKQKIRFAGPKYFGLEQ